LPALPGRPVPLRGQRRRARPLRYAPAARGKVRQALSPGAAARGARQGKSEVLSGSLRGEPMAAGFRVTAFDHVQLAMPPGREAEAERFYCGLLGFERAPKPAKLAARGGCWFRCGAVQIHLGVETDFRAA